MIVTLPKIEILALFLFSHNLEVCYSFRMSLGNTPHQFKTFAVILQLGVFNNSMNSWTVLSWLNQIMTPSPKAIIRLINK